MTEKEKRDLGGLYDPNHDRQLQAEMTACKELCHQYNQLSPSCTEERDALLGRILGRAGERVCVLAPFWCDYGENITVGDDFFANHNLVILDGAGVTFGDRVFIGPNCEFYTAGHPVDAERRGAGLEYAWPIRVGSDVWFGGGVQVMPGITIGSDVVIGSGSVVTRDVPDHVVAAGNPCRVLRAITDADRQTDFTK